MKYPRTHIIEHPKLKELLEKKTEALLKARQLSQDIEDIEKGMGIINEQMKELEAKVDVKQFEDEAEAATKEMQALLNKMKDIENRIRAKCIAEIPPELGEKYDKNKKLKEKLENERNKNGLKIQKYKDLIIPLTQKIAAPLLKDEFEDFSEVRLENGEVVIDIFSHLAEWKERRRQKLAHK